MTRFLIDNQLPAALARWLQGQGHQAEHVLALGMGQTADAVIWQHAARTGAVIVTKDEDFAQLTILRPDGVRSGCGSATAAPPFCLLRLSGFGRRSCASSMRARA